MGTGLWRCFVCNEGAEKGKVYKGGNIYTFLRKLWEESAKGTTESDYEELANDRGLCHSNTPRMWGCVRSLLSGDWLIPGFAPDGNLNTLYRYYTDNEGKRFLLATSELPHQLFYPHIYRTEPKGTEWDKRDIFICYSEDTEILTETGWKLFKDLTDEDRVAAYSKSSEIYYETPRARQVFDYTGPMMNFSSRWSDLLVTPDHRMLVRRGKHKPQVRRALDLGGQWNYPVSGYVTYPDYEDSPTEDEVRLLVAFTADGSIRGDYGEHIELRFKKERKKQRIRELLEKVRIPYRVLVYPSSPEYESIMIDNPHSQRLLKFCPNKVFTEDAVKWDLMVRTALIDELQYWDGDKAINNIRCFTSKEDQAHLLSRIGITSGYSSQVETKRGGTEFVVSFLDKKWRVMVNPPTTKLYQGKVYCVTVSTGFIVVRRNGKAMISGNCEGPWDGMAFWEVMRSTRQDEEGYKLCGNPAASMLSSAIVIAVPGCNVFHEKWCQLLEGKRVHLLYDSDHPKQLENGSYIDGAGFGGVKRVTQLLSRAENPPSEVLYLNWGEDGYDPSKPSGWDVRDQIRSAGGPDEDTRGIAGRISQLAQILSQLSPISPGWISASEGEPGSVRLTPSPCYDWVTLTKAWHRAMSFHEGLDRALSCMLAVITSTPMIDDQLWMKVIGPPSCGKSTLCEALNIASKYVISKSMITGFHSGYKTDKLGEEDNSLMAKIGGMTLVTKDADSLLSGTMNTGKILSQARDLFDGETRTFYGNQISRDYIGLRMTWILCGTNALHALDSSELGARFLNCVIMEEMEADVEFDIAWRAVNRQARNVAYQSNGEAESHKDKELTRAMQLTGGYINYLRENGKQLARGIKTTESSLRMCSKLGLFVSYLRARPSTRQEEKAERELCFRLSSQLTRLAMCLAIVLNKKELDKEVMRRTARVAMDTARGRTMEIVNLLYASGEVGQTSKYIAAHCNKELKKKREMLHFLRQIGVVELFQPEFMGVDQEPRYRLSTKLTDLYSEILEITGE